MPRCAPRRASSATELTRLWQGDVLEVRGEHAGYLKVYDYRRERGGYLRSDAARSVELTENAAPALLAVLRFLRESRGSEALGISYGAAYLKAVPPRAITAEPFDAIAQMAERLADEASGSSAHLADVAPHLDVVEQFGVHMRSFERDGRMQVCYDGELFRRVLALRGRAPRSARTPSSVSRGPIASIRTWARCRAPRSTASAGDCSRKSSDSDLTAMTNSRLHARRAAVWAALAYEQGRRREPAGAAAERALAELLAAHPDDLGEDRRPEYVDAVLRVSAIRWAAAPPPPLPGPLSLAAAPGDPGQTCIALQDARRPAAPVAALHLRNCVDGLGTA